MGALARRWVRRRFNWQRVARGYADELTQAAHSGERPVEAGKRRGGSNGRHN